MTHIVEIPDPQYRFLRELLLELSNSDAEFFDTRRSLEVDLCGTTSASARKFDELLDGLLKTFSVSS